VSKGGRGSAIKRGRQSRACLELQKLPIDQRVKLARELVGLRTDVVRHLREEEGLRTDRLKRAGDVVRVALLVLGIPAAILASVAAALRLRGCLCQFRCGTN
jgi:uncharacterized protein with ACT and thioredoxin-like domain